jgi:acyl dehydratase
LHASLRHAGIRDPARWSDAADGWQEHEMAGLWYEEFVVGHVFKHAVSRTVTETDNVLFSSLTLNMQPLHIDNEFAKKTEFGKPLVNSIFTLGLMIGISVTDTTLGTTVGNLGMTEVRFANPVFYGDTLSIETTVQSKRESQSRPATGIVEFVHRALNQHGQEVAVCRRSALMRKRPDVQPPDVR